MSLDGAYDTDNIFAKIVRGEIPAAKVMEDDHVIAFMNVFPQSPGHVLVISKTAKARNLLDITPADLGKVMAGVQSVAAAMRKALKPDGIALHQFNGAAAGQTVFHLHFHLIPRWADTPVKSHGEGGMADPADLKATAEQIAAAL
jgi:histidine triad (HIT) family protein